jgi:UDP-2,3-diacylglucosamine pyrophosphatase LpxH
LEAKTHNLLVLSDVHLGSELVFHVRPDAPRRTGSSERRDRDLIALLDWYRSKPVEQRPWRLLIGGDLIDFTGMSVSSQAAEIVTELTAEELAHGLGGAVDHAMAKLRMVLAHHADVMIALAKFVAAGNQLVIVPGNHDADWHWAELQSEFRERLAELGAFSADQVQFAPWFYYEEGLIYLEHGHQYDAYCSHDHVLHPVSPKDPKRTTSSLSDVLVRYVVRPTRGMTEGGHDRMGALDYLRFGLSLGASGTARLAHRFARANRALFELWREHVSEAAQWAQREHERKMRALSDATRISFERLRELAGLHRPPLTRSLSALAAGMMLDQIAVALASSVAFALVFVWTAHWGIALGSSLLVFALLSVARRTWFARQTVEPSAELRQSSARVSRLFPAPFVVMGHTHLPEVEAAGPGSTYVNLGAWTEEETADGSSPALPATRTHFVLVHREQGASAELLTWEHGAPQPFRSANARDAA